MAESKGLDMTYFPGVGPKRAEMLAAELGIHTIDDLLSFYPYKYVDRTKFYKVAEIEDTKSHIQIKGKITGTKMVGDGAKKRLVAYFFDGTSVVDLVWFKGFKQISQSLKTDREYILFGKPSKFGEVYNFVHPEVESIDKKRLVSGGYLHAFYNTTERMKKMNFTSNVLHKIMHGVVYKVSTKAVETIPPWMRERLNLLNIKDAIEQIHFPESSEMLERAQFRLKFEELFYIQLKLLHLKHDRAAKFKGHLVPSIGEQFNRFFKEKIPFELTGAQKRVLKEIYENMKSGIHMNRLVQGDVGSGKTMVALMAALMVIDHGFQASIMAPTEILATQHHESIVEMLDGLPINVKLLTGSSKKSERTEIDLGLQSGDINILIGTHALIEERVKFKNLGLVVIDEQHRFGVAQRSRLWKKNYIPPHVLVMTATPIPRTLAMTLYGDLDVSIIDELPPGRKPIETEHYFYNKRSKVNKFLAGELQKGRQVYVVYPLIEESETLDYQNLQSGYERMKAAFPDRNISMVHGRMKPAEKEEEMQRFKRHEADILVATTVIEVGVNVPNASVMVIESSERFGLSQLHQLRGRVGRGGEQSYCILLSSTKVSDTSKRRIETMVRTTDGFEIAEADLKLRGHGDMDGTQQSGVGTSMKIASISKDGQILQYARDIAEKILNRDPSLSHPLNYVLKRELTALKKNYFKWGVIS